MAGDISGSLIFKLCVIILATLLNSGIASNTKVAEISIEPLWDRTSNTSQCHVDAGFTGGFNLRGISTETCSLQVNLLQGNHLQLQIPGRNTSQKPSFIYIYLKRDGFGKPSYRVHCIRKTK